MKMRGIVMAAAGALLFLFAAFIYEPSVPSYGGGYLSRRIVNLDLQQRQLLLAMAGLTLFLAGVLVHAIGELAKHGPGGNRNDGAASSGPAVQKHAESLAEAELRARHGIRPGDDGAQV